MLREDESIVYVCVCLCVCRMKEIGHMTCNAELERSITACPRTPELYYFAARMELSRSAQPSPSKEAVRWLFRCVRDYYYPDLPADLSLSQVLILYRYVGGKWPSCG